MNLVIICLAIPALVMGVLYFIWLTRVCFGHLTADDVKKNPDSTRNEPAELRQAIRAQQKKELLWVLAVIALLSWIGSVAVRSQLAQPAGQPVFAINKSGKPQEIKVGGKGVSVLQAIQQIDVPTESTNLEDDAEEPWFLMIRPSSKSCTLYIPESFAVNGLASHFDLLSGDQIRWVNLEKTQLGVLDPPKEGDPFSVKGMIENPGKFQVLEGEDTLMSISTPEYAKSYSIDADGPNVLILTRKITKESPPEIYLLPLREPHLDMDLLESYLAVEDSFEYVRIAEPRSWWSDFRSQSDKH